MLKFKILVTGFGGLLLSSACPILVLATQRDKTPVTPILLECETNIPPATRCSSCVETLNFFKGNKVFGFNLYDRNEALQDAENVCQRENCEILSCAQVEGEVSGNFALKCNWGYVENNNYENIGNRGQKKKIRFGSFNISSIVGTTKEILQRELDESNITHPPFVSDCIIGTVDGDHNWRWLNE